MGFGDVMSDDNKVLYKQKVCIARDEGQSVKFVYAAGRLLNPKHMDL